jgi:hypothetical protein
MFLTWFNKRENIIQSDENYLRFFCKTEKVNLNEIETKDAYTSAAGFITLCSVYNCGAKLRQATVASA